MILARKKLALLAATAALAVPAGIYALHARGSDHADTPTIAKTPGADLSDVFVFPSPNNPANVVLVMNVHPLIPTGQSGSVFFDTDALYQFKIDNTGDGVEDLVIQARFNGTGPNQSAIVSGPAAPVMIGTQTKAIAAASTIGKFNTVFSPNPGITAFCGPREDPFFFDLNQFFAILPDRATPLTGVADPTPDTPKSPSFRGFAGATTAPGNQPASDFLSGFNLLSIVVELPRAQLMGNGNGKIGVWCTTSK